MSKRYPFAVIKEKLLEKGDAAIDFAIGRRPLGLPEHIDTWLRSNAKLALMPGSRNDMDTFRRSAAAYLAREYGVEVLADRILATPGGRAAMTALTACALNPGDKVFVTTPGYPAFSRLAAYDHADILEVPLDPANRFAPDVSAALQFRDRPVRIISINYPNNPTGATLSTDVIVGLHELCAPGSVVFNDATYGPLVYDESPKSLLGEHSLEQHGIELVELHSFSKLFPLGPVAISFLAGSRPLMDRISTYSEYAWSPLSRLQLEATALGMQDAKRTLELRRFFPKQICKLTEALTSLGFEPLATPAGVYVLCPVPKSIGGRAMGSAAEAAGHLMDEFDLAVVPVDSPYSSYLRFSSLYGPEDLQRLLALQARLALI